MFTFLLALCHLAIFLLALIFIFTLPFSPFSNKNGIPRNWPILGMVPAVVANFDNFLDWATVCFNKNEVSTIMIKGPWFLNHNLLLTIDPVNVQYTSSTRFSNFPRGPKSRENFDVFGDGFFNLDGREWEAHRKIHRSFFSRKQFNECSARLAFDKVEKGIVVVLDHVAIGGHLGSGGDGGVIDLQDLFSRYTYDLTHKLIVGYDPKSLSLEWSEVPYKKAMNGALQSIWMRHFLPEPFWKLLRRLGVGHEKTLWEAKDILNKLTAEIVATKHEESNFQTTKFQGGNDLSDILTTYFEEDHYRSGEGDEVLKGSLRSLLLAGTDTTAMALTWFFWIVSRHPSIEAKIRAEVAEVILEDEQEKPHVFTLEEISKLVYLHASVYETLRLYPPGPFQTRAPLEPDMLPSGHEVNPKSTTILIPLYTMARMKSVWGEDCAKFKPERWITKNGGFKHEASHKFFTFNSGPRICLGREVALIQIKVVIATMLHNYKVQVLEQQTVVPVCSVVLHTKYGLQARICKRWG